MKRFIDRDAIRQAADQYAMAAAWLNDLINGEKRATIANVESAVERAWQCAGDAHLTARRIVKEK